MYQTYCEMAKVPYPMSQRAFGEELKNYFTSYKERVTLEDGSRVRSVYKGFRADRFDGPDDNYIPEEAAEPEVEESWIKFKTQSSLLDKLYSDCKAQRNMIY